MSNNCMDGHWCPTVSPLSKLVCPTHSFYIPKKWLTWTQKNWPICAPIPHFFENVQGDEGYNCRIPQKMVLLYPESPYNAPSPKTPMWMNVIWFKQYRSFWQILASNWRGRRETDLCPAITSDSLNMRKLMTKAIAEFLKNGIIVPSSSLYTIHLWLNATCFEIYLVSSKYQPATDFDTGKPIYVPQYLIPFKMGKFMTDDTIAELPKNDIIVRSRSCTVHLLLKC